MLYGMLAEIASGLRQDTGGMAGLLERGRKRLAEAGFAVDYLEVRDAQTLAPLSSGPASDMRLLAAVRLGSTRLIDNVGV